MTFYEICFSPTGGTKAAADILTRDLSSESSFVDLTDYTLNDISLTKEDTAVIAVPSYGGRIPATAVQRMGKISGNGAKAILVCIYGNRAYEDTLIELQDVAEQAGFQVIAAVAAIAEHSIAPQFAAGRPDASDREKLCSFAEQIRKKLASGNTDTPSIPGNRPYKKAGGSGIIPKPSKNCVNCGLCAEKCPVQAIDKNNPADTDPKRCISCMRCVSICPYSARKVNRIMLAGVNKMLKKTCSERKNCELYL